MELHAAHDRLVCQHGRAAGMQFRTGGPLRPWRALPHRPGGSITATPV
ncbi:hypothetical protein SJ936_14725 [Enterococcus faecium]